MIFDRLLLWIAKIAISHLSRSVERELGWTEDLAVLARQMRSETIAIPPMVEKETPMLGNLFGSVVSFVFGGIAAKAMIPTADQPQVLAAANALLPPDAQMTQAQLVAADRAMIEYIEQRIAGTVGL